MSERPADRTDALRVSVLSEALPYIQRFSGRRVVVKYGGAAMVREDLRDAVYRDLVLLASVGVKPVVVHGGGPEINEWLGRLNIEPQFRNGLRVTCPDTMDVVEMVLVGRVNKQIVNGLNRLGARAVGLSGSDGPLVRARTYGDGANGLVGDVAAVDPSVLFRCWTLAISPSSPRWPPMGRARPTTSMPTPWPANWLRPWKRRS